MSIFERRLGFECYISQKTTTKLFENAGWDLEALQASQLVHDGALAGFRRQST